MVNKNNSESDNTSSRSRTRAAAKPAAPRQPARAASSRGKSSGDSAAPVDTAAGMNRAADAAQANPGYDEIAEAAYHRYLGRGGQDGSDVDDWVEAERELRSRRFP